MTQFTNSGLPISTAIAGANQYNKDGTISSSLASALGSFNGIAAGFYQGNWAMLLTALSSSTKNDILATPASSPSITCKPPLTSAGSSGINRLANHLRRQHLQYRRAQNRRH